MQEAAGELLVSRIWVRTDLPYRAMQVELGQSRRVCFAHQSCCTSYNLERLAELAESQTVDGILFSGDGSTLGRSGLRRGLRFLRARFPGWIGLQTRGPDPVDLQAVLAEGLLDFVDLQLAWEEVDADSAQTVIRTGPSLVGLKSILCRSSCRCVVRFTSPATGEVFTKVSSIFDAFVRNSAEPVAVSVFEAVSASADAAGGSCQQELLEFVACRPAWMVEDEADQWLQLRGGAPSNCSRIGL